MLTDNVVKPANLNPSKVVSQHTFSTSAPYKSTAKNWPLKAIAAMAFWPRIPGTQRNMDQPPLRTHKHPLSHSFKFSLKFFLSFFHQHGREKSRPKLAFKGRRGDGLLAMHPRDPEEHGPTTLRGRHPPEWQFYIFIQLLSFFSQRG